MTRILRLSLVVVGLAACSGPVIKKGPAGKKGDQDPADKGQGSNDASTQPDKTAPDETAPKPDK